MIFYKVSSLFKVSIKDASKGVLIVLTVLITGCFGGGSTVKPTKPLQAAKKAVSVSSSLQAEFKSALVLMKEEKYTEAVQVFKAIIEQEKRLSGPLVNMGIAYTQLQQYEEAEKAFPSGPPV